ncbi:FAD-dependent monooxygenase [Subtercola endophyticus]|uniref:FAD-dependent monooxygenase n=1 Tax=Subtercola endophyticus TaxID=2895559 RepID=UPI001E4E5079|nr:FAD-dependent monooxygenase [Subtercola endophyticus]UFS59805.1 FAD-dependent monooxygenase [Subtercola endophyticus]
MTDVREATIPVAIVGAGPVGLTLAALLSARGVNACLIERRSGASDEPKAISIDDESLRTYQHAGLLPELLRIVVPGTGTRYFDADGRPLFQAGAEFPGRLTLPFKNPFAQPDLERVLYSAVERDDAIQLRLATEVTGLSQGEDGVRLELRSDGVDQSLCAAYVVGADGGRSTIRAAAGIGMTGRALRDDWLVVDTVGDTHRERHGMHYGIPERPMVIVPGLAGRCRYEFRLFAGEGVAGERPEFSLIAKLLSPHRTIHENEIERAVVYRFNALNADTYRSGRLMLAGDAAHMMPPFAGQGLNSGIRDVENLAWKLAAVIQGQMPEQILDSYTDERRPQAGAVVASSARLGRVVMSTSRRVAELRDRRVRAALVTDEGRDFFENMRYRPANRFERGLLIPGQGVGSPLAQPWVFDMQAAKVHPLDIACGPDWTLIGVDVQAEEWPHVETVRAVSRAHAVHAVLGEELPRRLAGIDLIADLDGSLRRELLPNAGKFMLIRPDRVIAAIFGVNDIAGVHLVIDDWFVSDRAIDTPSSSIYREA